MSAGPAAGSLEEAHIEAPETCWGPGVWGAQEVRAAQDSPRRPKPNTPTLRGLLLGAMPKPRLSVPLSLCPSLSVLPSSPATDLCTSPQCSVLPPSRYYRGLRCVFAARGSGRPLGLSLGFEPPPPVRAVVSPCIPILGPPRFLASHPAVMETGTGRRVGEPGSAPSYHLLTCHFTSLISGVPHSCLWGHFTP